MFLLALACGCGEPSPAAPSALANGIYEVVASASDEATLSAATSDTRVLVFDRRFLRGGTAEPAEYVQLRTVGYAPLDLAEAPKSSEANGRPALLLTLQPDAGAALTKLTTRAKRAAVVIGGQVVTVHGIKVPIEGGKLQVSC